MITDTNINMSENLYIQKCEELMGFTHSSTDQRCNKVIMFNQLLKPLHKSLSGLYLLCEMLELNGVERVHICLYILGSHISFYIYRFSDKFISVSITTLPPTHKRHDTCTS